MQRRLRLWLRAQIWAAGNPLLVGPLLVEPLLVGPLAGEGMESPVMPLVSKPLID